MSGEDKCFNETFGQTIHTAFQQKDSNKKKSPDTSGDLWAVVQLLKILKAPLSFF